MRRDVWRRESSWIPFVLILFLLQFIFISSLATDEWITIEKTSNASTYEANQNILYTIKYETTNNSNTSAEDVVVVDILPNMSLEILDASPQPSSIVGNNITWLIGTLVPGETGSISLLIERPAVPKLDFWEDSGVSGYGFVNARKKLSNLEGINDFKNAVTISAVYKYNNEEMSYENNSYNSSSVSVDLSPVNISLKSLEHGSGYYKEDQSSHLNNTIPKISLNKDLSAQHEPVSLDLYGPRKMQINSLWSDRNSASTDDGKNVNSVSDDYSYMKSIDKETQFDINKATIKYSVDGNSSGGIAQFHYDRRDSGGKVPGSESCSAFISETYHGDFQITQSMDAYGDSPSFEKEASGTGFVSSQKTVSPDLRSGEQGTGSYQSEEAIQADTILKNVVFAYKPIEQIVGSSTINYATKWGETMYARNPEKNTEILNRFSYLNYLQKDALMGKSYLTMAGGFEGMNYLKARALNYSQVTSSETHCLTNETTGNTTCQNTTLTTHNVEEILKVEQLFVGNFSFETTIALGGAVEYSYPHINLTKKVQELNDNIVTYRIWVNNDGNQILAPVAVVDLLPEGSSYISSSLEPTVNGRVITWTIQAIPSGETTEIDLKVSLADVQPSVINKVQAVAKYQNRSIGAEASASPYDTVELQQEEEEFEDELSLWEETAYGLWAPPSCFNLNGSINCTCERYIDDFYNNLSGNCSEIP